jgi:division protein CdvB (Snf7/Vps24/ESCRT-III family)
MYANEIAELRKMSRVILRSQHSLEKVIIRLETVKEFGDVMNVLGPAINVVQQIQGELTGVVPEVAGDLAKVDEMLDTLLVEAGTVTGEALDITVHDKEARKVLEEASEIAAQRMKTSFPELPDAYKHLESDTESKG